MRVKRNILLIYMAIGAETLSRDSNRLWSFIKSQRLQSNLERIVVVVVFLLLLLLLLLLLHSRIIIIRRLILKIELQNNE